MEIATDGAASQVTAMIGLERLVRIGETAMIGLQRLVRIGDVVETVRC